MLPTEDNTLITLFEHKTLMFNLSLQELMKGECGWTNQHLYFTSDEKIKDLNWFINDDGLWQYTGGIISTGLNPRKVVATTNRTLIIEEIDNHPSHSIDKDLLPQIPQQFIEEYCKVGGIDKVLLEYEDMNIEIPSNVDLQGNYEGNCPICNKYYNWMGISGMTCYKGNHLKLKTDQNNYVIIHPIKPKLYTKEEVVLLLYRITVFNNSQKTPLFVDKLDNWIKENLK